MSKVKLDLQGKDFVALDLFAQAHFVAITGNANFPAPLPPPGTFDPALANYTNILEQITATEIALDGLRVQRGQFRDTLEEMLTERGDYVERTSGGDPVKIISAGFEVQAEGSATTSIDKPTDLSATMGDDEGEIDLSCHAVLRAKSYIIEYREHSDTAAPGAWIQGKVSTRSSCTISGFVSGKKYGFRIRALGPNELESPWSDEVVCMAP